MRARAQPVDHEGRAGLRAERQPLPRGLERGHPFEGEKALGIEVVHAIGHRSQQRRADPGGRVASTGVQGNARDVRRRLPRDAVREVEIGAAPGLGDLRVGVERVGIERRQEQPSQQLARRAEVEQRQLHAGHDHAAAAAQAHPDAVRVGVAHVPGVLGSREQEVPLVIAVADLE
ncbi:hypothetical protein GALL_423620 [mine drainage metagenome]|uniref:Uncharacterized protein n=1 Tax=mine drainage metagenome TaxID=410659 RepID=A0A1J5Q7W3_9ZZZZ